MYIIVCTQFLPGERNLLTLPYPTQHISTRPACPLYALAAFQTTQHVICTNFNHAYIQVLQKGSLFTCWNRWGRVGEDGDTNATKLQWGSMEEAVKTFEKNFKEKSGNAWADRQNFVKKDKKYQLVEVEDDGDEGEGGGGAALGKLTREQIEKGQAVLQQVRTCLEAGGNVPSALLHDPGELTEKS